MLIAKPHSPAEWMLAATDAPGNQGFAPRKRVEPALFQSVSARPAKSNGPGFH